MCTRLPSSTSLSTGLLIKLCKATQGFRLVRTSTLLTSLRPMILRFLSCREMQSLLEAVNHHAATVGMHINASKTKVMSALIPGDQRQTVLLDGELLRLLISSNTLVLFSSQTARAPKRSEAGLILPVPHSLSCNPVFGRGMKYRCVHIVVSPL